MARILPIIALAIVPVAGAQTESYRVYGQEITVAKKNAAVEACEYEELVENQRCNERVNKSQCIEDVHAECFELHGKSSPDNSRADNQDPR